MPRVTLRSTIPGDLPDVIGEPLPFRIRAITALVEGRVVGIGGIAFPPQGPAIAFVQLAPSSPNPEGELGCGHGTSEGVPEAKRYPIAFHRAGLMAMAMIKASEAEQVIATADSGSDVAVRWLKRLGFRPADDQRIEGKLLFIWRRDAACPAATPSLYATEARPPSPQ